MDREQNVDRAWRASAEVWPGAVARLLVLAMVLVVPWIDPDAGVGAWLWAPALVVLVCWVFTPELSDRGTVHVPTLLLPVLVASLLGVLQLLPLPTGLLAKLSPTAQRWWGLVDLSASEPDPTGLALASKLANHSVSLYPWGTKQSLAALAFGTVFLLAGARFFRRVVPFVWLCVSTSFLVAAAAAVFAYAKFGGVSTWPAGLDPAPVFFFGIAAALALCFNPRNPGRSAFGVLALFAAVGGLALLFDQRALIVAAAGGAAVVVGLVVALMPGRRIFIPAILVAASVAPWFVTPHGLRIPTEWEPFLRAGSGFGTAALLQSDRPPGDPSPASFIARLMVEGGWPALALVAAAVWLFGEALARLAAGEDRDHRGFLAAGLFLGPASVAWLGYLHWIASPVHMVLLAIFAGAVVGRGALNAQAPLTSTAFALPRWLPAPTFGTLLLAASLWAASVAWAADRTRAALAAAALRPTQQTRIAHVDEALLQLRPLVHHGDALALWRLAERRIDRFRLQTADKIAGPLKLDPHQAWQRSDPSEIFSRANYWRRTKQSIYLDQLRREAPVAQNLEQAYTELRAALAASPLVSEIALRNAQLRFMSDSPVNEVALLQLAVERSAPHPELLYAIGLEYYAIDRINEAAELWRRALDPASPKRSFARLEQIIFLLRPKMQGPRLLESVLPNHPEAYLTFAERLAGDDKNAVLKVAALEYAKQALQSANLTAAERQFHLGRWHAGVNELPKAIEAFRAAVGQDPENVRYRLALVRALEVKGDRPAALEEARRAAAQFPNDADVKAALERLQQPPKQEPSPQKQDAEKSNDAPKAKEPRLDLKQPPPKKS